MNRRILLGTYSRKANFSNTEAIFLQAVLWEDVGFFETNHGASIESQVVSSISTDTLTIQGVLTEKVLR